MIVVTQVSDRGTGVNFVYYKKDRVKVIIQQLEKSPLTFFSSTAEQM